MWQGGLPTMQRGMQNRLQGLNVCPRGHHHSGPCSGIIHVLSIFCLRFTRVQRTGYVHVSFQRIRKSRTFSSVTMWTHAFCCLTCWASFTLIVHTFILCPSHFPVAVVHVIHMFPTVHFDRINSCGQYVEQVRLDRATHFKPVDHCQWWNIWWSQGPLIVVSTIRETHLKKTGMIIPQMSVQRSDDEGACSSTWPIEEPFCKFYMTTFVTTTRKKSCTPPARINSNQKPDSIPQSKCREPRWNSTRPCHPDLRSLHLVEKLQETVSCVGHVHWVHKLGYILGKMFGSGNRVSLTHLTKR